MSLVLRHEPGRIGLSLDAAGWAPLAELVAKGGHFAELAKAQFMVHENARAAIEAKQD